MRFFITPLASLPASRSPRLALGRLGWLVGLSGLAGLAGCASATEPVSRMPATTATVVAPPAAPAPPASTAPPAPVPNASALPPSGPSAPVARRPVAPAAPAASPSPSPSPKAPLPPVAPAPTPAVLPTRVQTGRVLDEAGQPLVGATIILKGTTKGTSTDADGYYSLDVPPGENTFVFGYGGYEDELAKSRNGEPLTVTLLPTPGKALPAPRKRTK